ncbi:MAG: polysaccharide biosynthesis tyrosine autokinase [Verrucomicrobiota bacterium]|jgi:capsular exopolysaccharide synthesis family protein|nr:polysaccharide biosynthesis tyrosine autokinase [Verrucomicrobiota bacterium]
MDKTSGSEQSSDKLHILDYWRIIRVRIVTIILVFLLTAITTTLVTVFLPKTYMSLSRIAVEKDSSDIAPIMGVQATQSSFDPYFISTEFEKIQSQVVLSNVVVSLNLQEAWKDDNGGKPLDRVRARKRLEKIIDVSQYRNTSIIELRAYDGDEILAKLIAQALAEEYKKYRSSLQSRRVQAGINKLKERMEKTNNEISVMQAKVDALRVKLGISDAAGEDSYSIVEPEIVRRYESELITAKSVYTQQATLLQGLQGQNPEELRNSILTAYPDAQLDALVREYQTGQTTLANKSIDLGDGHPTIKSLKAALQSFESQIKNRIQGILAGLELRVKSSLAQVKELQKAVDDAKTKEAKIQEEGREYFDAKRKLSNTTRMRDTILFRIMQEEVDLDLPKTSSVEIIDNADNPIRPVRPNLPLNISLGVIIGLILGVGLAFFIEYLDTSVKTIDDVERALNTAVLGVIPQNVGSLVDEGEESPHAEAYRVLRTNILFAGRQSEDQTTFTVVSGGAGEGKTTTMFNLAVIFAQLGDRILVIDSDLRRPSMHRYFKVSNSIGLTNLLLGQNTVEEVVQITDIPNLHFIPSGKLPSSSMGVLSSSKMKDFVADMKSRYDYVFFDAPPIMGVSDASVLASAVDLCVLVVQYRKYPQLMTQRAKEMVTKVGGNLVGVVLNNINISQDSYYYYYSGYYYDNYYKSRENEEEPLDVSGPDAIEIKDKSIPTEATDSNASVEPKY